MNTDDTGRGVYYIRKNSQSATLNPNPVNCIISGGGGQNQYKSTSYIHTSTHDSHNSSIGLHGGRLDTNTAQYGEQNQQHKQKHLRGGGGHVKIGGHPGSFVQSMYHLPGIVLAPTPKHGNLYPTHWNEDERLSIYNRLQPQLAPASVLQNYTSSHGGPMIDITTVTGVLSTGPSGTAAINVRSRSSSGMMGGIPGYVNNTTSNNKASRATSGSNCGDLTCKVNMMRILI